MPEVAPVIKTVFPDIDELVSKVPQPSIDCKFSYEYTSGGTNNPNLNVFVVELLIVVRTKLTSINQSDDV